jgi:hypothetical protein
VGWRDSALRGGGLLFEDFGDGSYDETALVLRRLLFGYGLGHAAVAGWDTLLLGGVGDGLPVAVRLPAALVELGADELAAELAGVILPAGAVRVIQERLLDFVAELAWTRLQRGWHGKFLQMMRVEEE